MVRVFSADPGHSSAHLADGRNCLMVEFPPVWINLSPPDQTGSVFSIGNGTG